MQTITNTEFVRKRAAWGRWLSWIGFFLLFGAVFMSLRQELALWSFLVILVGFTISNIGMYGLNKYARPPLAHDLLDKALKGLDNRYRLYNYTTPVEHVILTPSGVLVVTLRRMGGEIRCTGDKWHQKTSLWQKLRFFAEDQLGNPAYELRRDVARLQRFLEARLSPIAEGEKPVPLGGLVWFANPEARLILDQPTVPVLHGRALKEHLRKLQASGEKLPQARYDELARILEGQC